MDNKIREYNLLFKRGICPDDFIGDTLEYTPFDEKLQMALAVIAAKKAQDNIDGDQPPVSNASNE